MFSGKNELNILSMEDGVAISSVFFC
jgi:hypothetical protein